MNCAVHPEVEATRFCRNCGKPMCAECVRDVKGVFYCEPCLAGMVQRAHTQADRGRGGRNAGVAFGLGFIPGLGAVYNGEYTKAIVHVAIFAGLITLASTGPRQGFYGTLIPFFYFYMPIEAFITARKKAELRASLASGPVGAAEGSPVTTEAAEVAPTDGRSRNVPVKAILMIVIGGIFLLDTLGWLDMSRVLDVGWPLLLIGYGGYLIWKRSQRGT